MKQTDFDKLVHDVGKLVEPMGPVHWWVTIVLSDEQYNALRKLVNLPGKRVAIHITKKGRIFLVKEKRS